VKRVLCLDDDIVIAQMVADVVRFVGHEPVVETDSVRAILVHARGGFSAAVVDLLMPRVNGVDVLAAFSEHSPSCRRILLTAAPNEALVREALLEGIIHRVLVKPYQLHEMKAALDWL